jgi:hypothetical protein
MTIIALCGENERREVIAAALAMRLPFEDGG